MNALLPDVIAAEPVERKFLKAVKAGEVDALEYEQQLEQAMQKGVISEAEGALLARVRKASFEFISVDDFGTRGIACGREQEAGTFIAQRGLSKWLDPRWETFGRLSGSAIGRWLFSRLVCWRAPYFGSIHPHIETLEPGRCVVRLRQRRRIQNHLGTVHAIALCNAAELAGGLATDVTIPGSMRWIPQGHERALSQEGAGRLDRNCAGGSCCRWCERSGIARECGGQGCFR